MRLIFLLVFCATHKFLSFAGRVKVRIFDHRAEHDPISNYGTGPFKFRGYGWGINYEYEPNGSFQQEKGYGFVKIFGRDFCKFKDKSRCRDADNIDLYSDYKSFNHGEPFWGQPPADVVRDHDKFTNYDEPSPTGPREDEEEKFVSKSPKDVQHEPKIDTDKYSDDGHHHNRNIYRSKRRKSSVNKSVNRESKKLPKDDHLRIEERPDYDDEVTYYRRLDYDGPPVPPRRFTIPAINREYDPSKKYSSIDDDLEERKIYLHQTRRRKKVIERVQFPQESVTSDHHHRTKSKDKRRRSDGGHDDGHDLVGKSKDKRIVSVRRVKLVKANLPKKANLIDNFNHAKYFVRIPKQSS